MTAHILSQLHDIPTEESSTPSLTRSIMATSSTSRTALQSLPPECLAQVCALLPIADLASLRLCCKALAIGLPLDQHFWREQLLCGHLFGLRDLDQALVHERLDELRDRDWKRLVGTLARYQNFQGAEGGKEMDEWGELYDAPIGLKNRRRIWKIIREICN